MKMKMKYLLTSTILMLLIVNTINAQVFRISAFSQQNIVMGDFSKKEINSSSAGYVDFGSTGGIEVNYYLKNNLGFGLRFLGNFYERDTETYETDLTKMLGITDDQYDFTETYVFGAFGSDLGISYQIDIANKLQLEPYFYLGFKGLVSPISSVIYSQNNTTYQYKTKSNIYAGFSYSPGVKLNWNILKNFGLYFSFEFNGNVFDEGSERSIMYNYNTLEITDSMKSYNINSLNIGIGLAFRFGKGLAQ